MKEKGKNGILLFFKGFLMGIAEIVPGVSGSTLALIVGIYRDFISLLYQISNVVKEFVSLLLFKSDFQKFTKVFKKINFRFAIILFLGMLSAILLFSNVIDYLLIEHRNYVMAFFFGLVLASITIPWGEIKKKTGKEISIVIVTTILFFLILSIRPQVFAEAPHPLYFFLGGALGICAMVLPGVSGSFIFLMLGLYEYIVTFISNLTKLEVSYSEIIRLVSLALGIFFGFTIFVRVLKYGLKKHSSIIFAFLTGLMIASLRVLWPFDNSENIFYITAIFMVGFVLVIFLKKIK
jgi:putative membrane protein